MFLGLEKVKTIPYGSTLEDVIRTGLKNPDSAVGIFAPDADAYRAFRRLFLPIILDYHKLVRFEAQPDKFWGNPENIGEFEGNQIVSTRIRIARSIKGKRGGQGMCIVRPTEIILRPGQIWSFQCFLFKSFSNSFMYMVIQYSLLEFIIVLKTF